MSTRTARTIDQLHADLRNGALATDAKTRQRYAQAARDAALEALASKDSTPSQRQSALSCFSEARALFDSVDELPPQYSSDPVGQQP